MMKMTLGAQTISSRSNSRVKQLRGAFAGNLRLSDGLLGLEGDHLIAEALRSGVALHTVFVAEGRASPPTLPGGTEVIQLSQDIFASAVATEAPQGIAALFVPPKIEINPDSSSLLLVAVGLQDPGNLGTLIRSAEAFGASGILVTPGTVSVWNQKVIRASVGSVFRVAVEIWTDDQIFSLKQKGIRLLAAVADEGTSPDDTDLRGGSALMIGNEGAGLSPAWIQMADARITLQYPGKVESLNAAVAGSLLLYEASRQRLAVRSVQTGKP